jgi:hypothetical protein
VAVPVTARGEVGQPKGGQLGIDQRVHGRLLASDATVTEKCRRDDVFMTSS